MLVSMEKLKVVSRFYPVEKVVANSGRYSGEKVRSRSLNRRSATEGQTGFRAALTRVQIEKIVE